MLEVAIKAITLIGFATTLGCSFYYCKRAGLDSALVFWAGVWGIAGAIYGGYLYSLALGPTGSVTAISMLPFAALQGNKGVLGAILGAALLGGCYLRRCRAPLLAYMESALPAVMLGYAICRIACFINGDDFGVPSDVPWAISFVRGTDAFAVHLQRGWIDWGATASLAVHPTQLYHILAALLCFVFLQQKFWKLPGDRLAFVLVFYGVSRYVIQYYRDDHWQTGAAIDPAQWFCLLFIVSGIMLAIFNRASRYKRSSGLLHGDVAR